MFIFILSILVQCCYYFFVLQVMYFVTDSSIWNYKILLKLRTFKNTGMIVKTTSNTRHNNMGLSFKEAKHPNKRNILNIIFILNISGLNQRFFFKQFLRQKLLQLTYNIFKYCQNYVTVWVWRKLQKFLFKRLNPNYTKQDV